MVKCFIFLFFAFFHLVVMATPNAPGESHFRLGPFFEWRAREDETFRLAIRPFFAWEADATKKTKDKDLDIVWPLTHSSWRQKAFRSRVLLFFWQEEHGDGVEEDDFMFAMPPLWVNGRDAGKHYFGLFPLYGRLPRFILLKDFQWALFPLWLSYRTDGPRAIRRDYIVWPFFSLKHDPDQTRWSLWPLYGTKKEPGFQSRFVLWPFWNDYRFTRENHRGTGHMLWPIYSRINTNTEQGFGLLPPFFSVTTTTSGAFRLQAPWPLFERYTDPKESTWKLWRFWGITNRGSRHFWWFLYPIVRHSEQSTESQLVRRSYFWPFYSNEKTIVHKVDGTSEEESSYFRIWPFYSSVHDGHTGFRRRRALELMPFRDFPTIERNWSPFWTFYTATQQPGEKTVLHELFWGLIWWHTTAEEEAPYPTPTREE